MSSRCLLKAATLCVAVLLVGTLTPAPSKPNTKAGNKVDKPDKGDKGDKAGKDNKPAKVSWTPKRVEMENVSEDDGTIVVQLSADKEVLGVTFFASGSLRGVIGLPDSLDIPEGKTVEVEFELLKTPDEAGHTIGGTIQAMSGGKHLAQPLTFSLKRSGSSTTTEEPTGEDEPELMDSNGKLPLSWLSEDGPLEDITLDLFDETGMATITMVANRDLENLGLWFTPSVSACISAAFDTSAASMEEDPADQTLVFDDDGNIEFVAAGTEVPVLLTLTDPTEWTCGGGTLHARSVGRQLAQFPRDRRRAFR